MSNLKDMSEEELASLINSAQKTLNERNAAKRKEVTAKIKDLAASVGLSVELTEIESDKATENLRKGRKVSVKYRDPHNQSNEWTGRGMQPKWLRKFIEQGHTLEEFAID
jgi:DNA-binding protein H-NS